MSIPNHAYLNELAACKIAELEAEGVTVSHADAVMLNAICWALRGEGMPQNIRSRGRPVDVGGVRLWPYTIQAICAVEDIDTSNMSDEDQLYAFAYILAHGREQGVFDKPLSTKKVRQWAKRLTCTPEELQTAIQDVTLSDSDFDTGFAKKEKQPMINMIATLQRLFGQTAEYWEREVSSGYASLIIMDYAAEQAGKQASAKSVKLTRAMLHCIDQIREKANDGTD